ncbi:TetR/AcrR family transcriptional regulator [Nocardioides mangrovi]|uniref:TetR/AcrR family transcriptional regulator n=1 Tax=Nocardioides mangrovi TaxID=2874580 RepID=A0ABS7UII7_9ACTN|nr:TetR/AcrR family transcriptional regulator [Nocardioides mangrovi]MBZ5740854.1 TetR/AcrR family transcriptional regulator [Nocardioides mangrovi]
MPRISGESLREHREQLQRRVFSAFAELMGERSFDAISMAAIAERADVGRTSIYHHFPDKESVVVAFASHETEEYLDRLRDVLTAARTPADQLRSYVRHHLAEGERFHMGLGPQLYGVLGPESRQAIRTHVVAVEDVLRGIIVAGVADGSFAVDDVDGTMSLIHACLNPRHLPPTTIEAFVLGGVSA